MLLLMIKSDPSPGGEISRHKGLKILEGNFVPVQVRPGHQLPKYF